MSTVDDSAEQWAWAAGQREYLRPESSEIVPEVCLAHRDAYCKVCDGKNDELWVHPRDLPPPHEDCRLCHQLIDHRRGRIENMQSSIRELQSEIAEIENGGRHNDYHEARR